MFKGFKMFLNSFVLKVKTGSAMDIISWVGSSPSRLYAYIKNAEHIERIDESLKDKEMVENTRIINFCWNYFIANQGNKLRTDGNVVKYFKSIANYHPSNFTDEFLVQYQYILNAVDTELGPYKSIIKIIHAADGLSTSQHQFLLSWAEEADNEYLTVGNTFHSPDGTKYVCKGPNQIVDDNRWWVEFMRSNEVAVIEVK